MLRFTLCLLAALCSNSLVAQQPPASGEQQPAQRVPGQPGSPEELAAFQLLASSQIPEQRIQLGNQFLTTYPSSGLSSFVHHILANAYGLSDPTKFITHAEMALQELPRSPSLLATLAFIYAETGKTALGAERGRSALEVLQSLEKPPQLDEATWLVQKLEVGGQANYAIGRHLLGSGNPEARDPEKLEEASTYLLRAMEQLPDDPYASFRLAEAYLQLEEVERALTYFARTAAVGGSVGEIARQRVTEIYEAVHSNRDGLDELLKQQEVALQKARDAREAMLGVFADPQSNQTPPARQPQF